MIADVAVPVAGVDGALSYAIPRALEARVVAGMRVLVPVAGRRVVGLVVAVHDRATSRELKSLHEILDDAPIVDEKQLALVHFVASYYAADVGACARLVMPPDTERVVERRFRLTERGEQARVLSSDLTKHDLALLAKLDAGVSTRERAIVSTRAQRDRLATLVQRNYVEQVADERAAGAVRFDERLVALPLTATPVRPPPAVEAADRTYAGAATSDPQREQQAGGARGPRAKRAAGDVVDVERDPSERAEARAEPQPLPKNAPALAAFDAWLRALAPATPTIAEAQAAHTNARGKAAKLVALGRIRIERTPTTKRAHASLDAAASSWAGGLARSPTDAQLNAIERIVSAMHASEGAFLLEGVTGSGKTEVYLRALLAALAAGKGAILIVPEIGLTPQLVGRVKNALADVDVVVLHSGITAPERRDGLARLRAGTARVVVGARSALFAPVQSLGLVVVDEEHDASLKQDEAPRYHGRDVALWRAKNEGAVCVLGSATPSLETRHNVTLQKIEHLELPTRVGGGGELPDVGVIDLRARAGVAEAKARDRRNADEGPGVVLSAPLVEAMAETLSAGEQVLLFLNKRGYWSALLCEACGHIEQCPNCSVTLTIHRRRNVLVCHQCDHEHLVPTTCPDCGNADTLVALGLGTERLETEVRARFPDARVARLDRDTTQKKGALEQTLAAVHAREVDVVVGTQMIAKGHDFPGVTLVGVVLADIALAMPDFRAQERAFALLTQVAGRAGRAEKKGRVLVQTFKPESAAVRFAALHDVIGFADVELKERELHRYPPFVRAALFRVEHENAIVAATLAADVKSAIDAAARSLPRGSFAALGPAPCAMERAHGRTRWQVFVRAQTASQRAAIVDGVRKHDGLRRDLARHKARFVIDVDPVQLL